MVRLTETQVDLLNGAIKGKYTVLPSFRKSADALERKGLVFCDRLEGCIHITPAGRAATGGEK